MDGPEARIDETLLAKAIMSKLSETYEIARQYAGENLPTVVRAFQAIAKTSIVLPLEDDTFLPGSGKLISPIVPLLILKVGNSYVPTFMVSKTIQQRIQQREETSPPHPNAAVQFFVTLGNLLLLIPEGGIHKGRTVRNGEYDIAPETFIGGEIAIPFIRMYEEEDE